MHPLGTYLTELHNIHSSGASTPETAYYAALANLLNEIGKTIKPRVRCIMGLKDQGAEMPDGGLFTADQVKASEASGQPRAGTTSKVWPLPVRGMIEVKGTGEDDSPGVEIHRRHLARGRRGVAAGCGRAGRDRRVGSRGQSKNYQAIKQSAYAWTKEAR